MKEKLCEKYFENKVKPKHLREFEAKTPKGNMIKGYISRKANRYLGSLVITRITEKNGKSYDCEQFVQSFPKIHYWDSRHKLKEDDVQIIYHCQEKLDGTCIVLYSLNDDMGNSIEVVAKTRSQAVADPHILDMYKLIDSKAVDEFFSNPLHNNDTLMFELFGVLNKHDITHIDTYIDMNLIGACIEGEFLNYIQILCNHDLRDFRTPETIFTIEKYPHENEFSVRWCDGNLKLRNYRIACDDKFPSLYDAIEEIKVLMQTINGEYFKNNGRRVIEGVVINGEHFQNGQMYLKVKPRDIEMEARQPDSVPRRFVLKEVQKYFDEFGSNVKSLYENDDMHYINYVRQHLKEEFTYEQIQDPRTLKRIRTVFMEVWDSKIPPKSLQNIAEELVYANPDASASELMKIFAKTYPSKKKDSRTVYHILTAILKRQ
jgi:ribosomal protein S17E